MKRRMAILTISIACAVLLCGPSPNQVRADTPDYVIHSDVRLVLLDVSVKDSDGGFVAGLSKDNFRIDENGNPQGITVFANNDIPVTVGLVVDNSLSMTPKRPEVLSAASAFIEESNPRDEIFVLNFNETVKRGLPKHVLFSDDLKLLRDALSRARPEGRTALNDAIIDGLKQLEMGKRDKKTLVVISDGGDNISQHTTKEMLDAVESSIATVYTIGLFDYEDPDRNPNILKKLARITGGQAYFPEDPADLKAVCEAIAKDIRTRYTVGYQPRSDNGGLMRRIHLKVYAPGRNHLVARTRTSYVYNAAAGPGGQ